MPDVWTFGPVKDGESNYSDGTVVPHRMQRIFYNGKAVGEVEIHMHKRKGPDGAVDVSVGVTSIVYGPAPGGQ